MTRNYNPACGPAKPPAVFPRGPSRSMSPVPVPPQQPPGKFLSPVPVPQPPGKFLSPVPVPQPPGKFLSPVPVPQPPGKFLSPVPVPQPGPKVMSPVPVPQPGPKVPTPAALPVTARAPNPSLTCPTGYKLYCWNVANGIDCDCTKTGNCTAQGDCDVLDVVTPTVGPQSTRGVPQRFAGPCPPGQVRMEGVCTTPARPGSFGSFGSIQPQRPVPSRRDPVLARMAARRGMLPT